MQRLNRFRVLVVGLSFLLINSFASSRASSFEELLEYTQLMICEDLKCDSHYIKTHEMDYPVLHNADYLWTSQRLYELLLEIMETAPLYGEDGQCPDVSGIVCNTHFAPKMCWIDFRELRSDKNREPGVQLALLNVGAHLEVVSKGFAAYVMAISTGSVVQLSPAARVFKKDPDAIRRILRRLVQILPLKCDPSDERIEKSTQLSCLARVVVPNSLVTEYVSARVADAEAWLRAGLHSGFRHTGGRPDAEIRQQVLEILEGTTYPDQESKAFAIHALLNDLDEHRELRCDISLGPCMLKPTIGPGGGVNCKPIELPTH